MVIESIKSINELLRYLVEYKERTEEQRRRENSVRKESAGGRLLKYG